MTKNKGKKLVQKGYTVEVRYSDEAIKNKLLKFTLTEGNSFEIKAEELISMLVTEVNSETLAPTFVETDRVNVVEVGRQLQCVLDKDMKKGEKININYSHPYPIEYALIEEAYKIAKINKDVPALSLTVDYIEDVKKKIQPEMNEYINKFYKSFKNLKV